jgi:hypothetical protein
MCDEKYQGDAMTSEAGWQAQSNEQKEWDYDHDLHIAWVDAAMALAYDFAEAYCNVQCVNDSDNLHVLNTARRALRAHLQGRPASMEE